MVGIILLWGAVFVFIPNIISLKASTGIKATSPGLHRMLLDKSSLEKWWPGKINNGSLYFNDNVYTIRNSNITLMQIAINGEKTNLLTSLLLITVATDSTQMEWVSATASSYNPLKRFAAHLKAKKIGNDMEVILAKMKNFYSDSKNIYDFEIKKEFVADSILIQTSGISKGYPTNQFIYTLIDKLKKYAVLNAAKVTGYPMLNVNTEDSLNFAVKVALPVDKVLTNTNDILQKRMLGRGNILVTEVIGGNSIANKAIVQIKKYAEDYKRVAPAIPFYSLITDRTKEADSSKWITKIYYPVM